MLRIQLNKNFKLTTSKFSFPLKKIFCMKTKKKPNRKKKQNEANNYDSSLVIFQFDLVLQP